MPRDSKRAARGELVACWGYADGEGPDLCYFAGEGVSRADQSLLHYALTTKRYAPLSKEWDPSFIEELEARGYDLTTLEFSIRKKDGVT